LRDQGLNDEAVYYAYRAQVLRRKALLWQVLKGAVDTVDMPQNESEQDEKDAVPLRLLQKGQKLAAYAFSGFLALLSGYGYKPQRCLIAYIVLILALSSFSFQSSPTNPYLALESVEAIFGLLIEALIVAIFTQRILGK
jgi:hypothetical protein